MSHRVTEESFLKDVKDHKITILRDDGLYRHIGLGSGRREGQYDLVTWPGSLFISSKIGSYHFTTPGGIRCDMFESFRKRKDCLVIDKDNLSEWLESSSINSPHIEFDQNKFFKVAKEQFFKCEFDCETNIEELEEKFDKIVLDGLKYCDTFDCGMYVLFDFANKTGFCIGEFGNRYNECHQYTSDYIWCLYAIVWGIQQYDAAKTENGSNSVMAETEQGGIITDILKELSVARQKFPSSIHSLAALQEEVGELAKDLLHIQYEPDKKKTPAHVYREAVQVAVMAIRVATEGDATFPNYKPAQVIKPVNKVGVEAA